MDKPENIPFNFQKKISNSKISDNVYKYVYLLSEHVLSYPFIRIRKILQLNKSPALDTYHLYPFSIIPIVYQIQSKFGVKGLFQGLTSDVITKGLIVIMESSVSEFLNTENGVVIMTDNFVGENLSIKKIYKQALLSIIVNALATPFFCVSATEIVQGNLVCENTSLKDFFYDIFFRATCYKSFRTTRIIPTYLLIPPTIAFGTLRFFSYNFLSQTINLGIRKFREDNIKKNIEDKVYNEIICSITANFITSVILYPVETILIRLYVQGTRTLTDNFSSGIKIVPVLSNYQGFFDCRNAIIEQETSLGFYKGFSSLILQFTLQFAIIKLTRNIIKKYV